MAWWNDGSSLANSVISYWKLDEASGSRADSVGSNTLTDNATVTSSTGLIYSLAADFASANSEYLSHADNASLSISNIDFWLAAWVKADDLTSGSIVGKCSADTVGGYEYSLYLYDTGEIGFVTGNGTAISASKSGAGTVVVGEWYLAVGYYNHTTQKLGISLNGGAPVETTRSQAPADTAKAFEIGRVGTTYKNMVCGPVGFGKSYLITTDDLFTIFREAPNEVLASWWLGNSQISSANVLEHVEIPTVGQNYAGSSVADGQPWTVAIRSKGLLASTNIARVLFDSQDGRFAAGINSSASYGMYNGSAWSGTALFTSTADHVWVFVSNGTTVQAYLDDVAVGSAQSNTTGLAITGATKWGSDFGGNNPWINPLIAGAVYNVALTSAQRTGLYFAMLGTNVATLTFTATDTFVAPTGTTSVTAEAWGGGGNGGGGAITATCRGGGGGAYAGGTISVTPGSTYTATVAAAASGSDSEITGDSSTQVLAKGGTAGGVSSGSGATGGQASASVGTTKFDGGNGGSGNAASNFFGGGGGGSAGRSASGGNGGNANVSVNGAGGSAGAGGGGAVGGSGGNVDTAGNGGAAPGGGGGGCGGGSTNRAGGNGGRGQVVVTWTYSAITTSPIVGNTSGSVTVTGVLKAQGKLVSAVPGTSTIAGVLKGKGKLVSVVAGTSTAVGILRALGKLVSVVAGTSTADAVGKRIGVLKTTEAGVSTATGVLKATGKLQAAEAGTSTASAYIAGKILIFGLSAGASSVTGILFGSGNLVGASSGIATGTGVLFSVFHLSASVSATSNAIGRLTDAKTTNGHTNGTSTATGTLVASGRLAGATAGSSLAMGDVLGKGRAIAVVAGVSSASGTLFAFGYLRGQSSGIASSSGTLFALGHLSGQSNGIASVSAAVFSIGYIFGDSHGTILIIGAIMALGRLQGSAEGSSTAELLGGTPVEFELMEVAFKGMFRSVFKGIK